MAGDWIKVESSTPDKPEIDRIAQATGLDHDAVLGKCIRFWAWADQQSVDGDALSVTQAFIDRLVFHPGFAKALRGVGWLDGRDGHLSIPGFARHNGESAKKRAQSAKRNANLREKRRSRDAHSVTTASPREEKRREDNSHTLALPILKDERFAEAWNRWKRHRIEKHKPLGMIEEETQLMELSRFPDQATSMVEFSIRQGAVNLITNGDHAGKPASASPAARSAVPAKRGLVWS